VGLPDTERLDAAQLLNMYIENGIIFAQIQVEPVETETYDVIVTNLPVIRRP